MSSTLWMRSLLEASIDKSRRRSKIKVKIVEGTNNTCRCWLSVSSISSLVVCQSIESEQEYCRRSLQRTMLRSWCARDTLIGRTNLSLRELVHWSWIMPCEETTLRRQLDEAFRREGVEPPHCSVKSVSILANRALPLATDYLAVGPLTSLPQRSDTGLSWYPTAPD